MTVGQVEREYPRSGPFSCCRGKRGYRHLENWHDREDNSNIKEDILQPLLIHRDLARDGNFMMGGWWKQRQIA